MIKILAQVEKPKKQVLGKSAGTRGYPETTRTCLALK